MEYECYNSMMGRRWNTRHLEFLRYDVHVRWRHEGISHKPVGAKKDLKEALLDEVSRQTSVCEFLLPAGANSIGKVARVTAFSLSRWKICLRYVCIWRQATDNNKQAATSKIKSSCNGREPWWKIVFSSRCLKKTVYLAASSKITISKP
jgi:hypothetical protein